MIEADGREYRNILSGRRRGVFDECTIRTRVETDLAADTQWSRAEVQTMLGAYGLPIGSGAIESAADHVVQRRMKRAGMRWSEAGGDAMLALRARQRSRRPLAARA